MPLVGNAIDNNVLVSMANRAGPAVTSAIQKASLKTGVNFAYLMQKADTESSFDTDAKARGSSAKGLYQFINSTWMHMVKTYGDKYGLGDYADKISNNGKVASASVKKEILALRDNPEISALMAGEYAAENKQRMMASGIKDKDIGSTELYMAHFMGPGGASEFIKSMNKNPLTSAADLFPQAAKANHNVFYTKTQKERSLGEVYAMFDRKFAPTADEAPKTLVAQAQTQTRPPEKTSIVHADTETAHVQYASNSILRALPTVQRVSDHNNNASVLSMLNDEDSGEAYALDRPQQPIPLPLNRNNLVSDSATLMSLAQNTTEQKTQARAAATTAHTHAPVTARRAEKNDDERDDERLQNVKMAYMARINYGAMNN